MSTVVGVEEPPSNREQYLQEEVSKLLNVPAPLYRHAAPSAPWPWMNFDADSSEVCLLSPDDSVPDFEWRHYPQSLFGNWTHDQVERCGMLKITHNEICSVHKVDVFEDGSFDGRDEDRTVKIEAPKVYWDLLKKDPPSNIRVRALFVENMTEPVLQILGTRYNIEPFFFASSANWIPSRYQEDPKRNEDHITVVLPFIRTMKNQKPIVRAGPVRTEHFIPNQLEAPTEKSLPYQDDKQIIDTQVPILLPDNRILLQDLLAIHMYRTSTTSTIISYHPSSELQRTSAWRLHSLVQRTGDSVYWSEIFKTSKDPTFLFLAILWYALYAWDEAFEVLYKYINDLEFKVLKENDIKLTRELHKLQAHLLHYQQLLRDFRVSVKFVKDTPNPAMTELEKNGTERKATEGRLHREANSLMSEIDRLDGQRQMLSDRIENVTRLAFTKVNVEDARAIQKLAQATVIDSAAMKQIAYLTTTFLPATFIANVFSMNVAELVPKTTGSLWRYIYVTVGFTLVTVWVAITLQQESYFHPKNAKLMGRVLWPVFYVYNLTSALIRMGIRSAEPQRGEIPLILISGPKEDVLDEK